MYIRDMRSISLGRELGAIAQAPFFREPFSGFFEPRKAFREKTPRGYRKGTDSPLARKILHGKRKPKQDVHSGYAKHIPW